MTSLVNKNAGEKFKFTDRELNEEAKMFHGPSGLEYLEIDPDHIDTEIRAASEFDSAEIRGSLMIDNSM